MALFPCQRPASIPTIMFKRASIKKIKPPTSTPTTTSNGNQDVIQSPIRNLISAERAVLLSSRLQQLSVDYAKSAEALRTWGLTEDNDLGGILTASTTLLNHFSLAMSQFLTLGNTMQRQLEVMAKMGESLDSLKQRRNTAHQKADETINQMNKMLNPDNKIFYLMHAEALKCLRRDISKMDEDIKLEETTFNHHKQSAAKSWIRRKFSGLYECCEKGMIAGKYGNLAVAELEELKDIIHPGMPRSLHLQSKVKGFIEEADRHVDAVGLSDVESRNSDQNIQESSNALSAGSKNSSKTGHKAPPHPPPKAQSLPHYDHASYPQNIPPFRGGKGHFPERQDSSFPPSSGPPYAPSYQQQLSQVNRSRTALSPQRLPRVNEDAVDDFGAYDVMPRSNGARAQFTTPAANTRSPSPSESSAHSLQELVTSGRYLNGGSSYSAASSHLQSPLSDRFPSPSRSPGPSESGRYLSQDSAPLDGRDSPGGSSSTTGTSHWQDRVNTRSPNSSEMGGYSSHESSTSHWQNHSSGRLPRPLPPAPVPILRGRQGSPLHLQGPGPINTGSHSASELGIYPSQDSLSLDGRHRGLTFSEGTTSHWTPSRFSSVTGSSVTSEGMIRTRRGGHQTMNSWGGGGSDPEDSPPAYMSGSPESLVVAPETGSNNNKGKW